MKYIDLMKNDSKNQTMLSIQLGVSQKSISNYMKGITTPDLVTLIKLADYYGVSLDYLCDHKTKNQLDYGPIDEKRIIAHNILQKLPDNEFYAEFGRLQMKAETLGIQY